MAQEPQRDEDKGRVLQFRPKMPRARNDNLRPPMRRPPVEDIGKYARGHDDDNYTHRMINNVLAFLVLALIVSCGIWLANTMDQMRRDQDCVLSGRTNCSPIKIPNDRR